MPYALLADLVLIFHAVFVIWVIFGAFAAFWKPWLIWLHLPALLWGATVAGMGWICPLTPLENALRSLAGAQPYGGDFIQHYLTAMIYPRGLSRGVQAGLAVLLVVGNVLLYAMLYRRRRHSDC